MHAIPRRRNCQDSVSHPMESSQADQILPRCHVVAIPYPGRGHINPMMSVCRLLASRGLLVSVVLTEEWLGLLCSGSAPPPLPNLRLVSIPNVIPSERSRGADLNGFFQAVYTRMEAPVERLLERLEPPADSIVVDANLVWAAEIGRRRSIPVTSFWTEAASVLLALYRYGELDDGGETPVDLSDREEEALSFIPTPVSFSSHSTDFTFFTPGQDSFKKIIPTFSWFNIAQGLLVPTFYDLESHAIDTLKSKLPLPIYPIGPCIPYMTLDNPQCNNNSRSDYIKWLDSQPKSSVLYISLGSFMPISGTQMEEMASGIHASGVRFLWIVREEFKLLQELSGEMGLVLPWCDQLRVLCHPSVGGFLTHCGWSSTMEGVFAGIPMLTFPLIWDQFPNSRLIVDDWKVGVRVKISQEQVVGREEIAKVVHDLMNLDALESKELRRRAKELKEKCHRALGDAGSSTTNLNAFVQEILDKKCGNA
ncbi:UDP-glycosyltransferase 87A2 [Elaeis guineensis]|uniref:Glycosyltransferase n=1 Tax=Elaeis guineensis var. tenera TaxID=51953 RepID=A0A6I9RS47_ELAGV|nr:UDP-glycosyltransferase 87A2 [Elaeis guineensis]